jgi:RHS repeat-associated protein
VERTLDGTAYDFNLSYDAQGRLDVLTYPDSGSGYHFKVDYDYDTYGQLVLAKDGNTGATYYQLDAADALERDFNTTLGNGLHEYRRYDRATGTLTSIETDPGTGASIQDLDFTYDEVGNVLTRHDGLIGKTETFVPDALNRLTSAQVSGTSAVTVAYSAAGRIDSKSDVGSYAYGDVNHPQAVTSAGGVAYAYNANGRMTSRGGSAISWFSYDLPKRIDSGSESAEFAYGVDRARYKQIERTGSTVNATIYYVGGLFEKEVGASTTYRHYVSARGRAVALVKRVGTTNTVQYLHRDHQGSVVKVTSASGTVADSLAFDAWGLRRNATNWAALGSPFGGTQQTERGYTGHEHLDNVGLIHMNGRVQDPRIGRFLSPDPTVQDPFNTQSHDRYSYAWNNPATLVDPSGFQSDEPNHTVGPCLEGMSGEDCLTLISMDPSRTSMNYTSDSHVLSAGYRPQPKRLNSV